MVLVGEHFDRPTYEILHTILEGNASTCHLVRHEIFQTLQVQKTVSLLGLDDAAAYGEPGLLSTLQHDHVVRIHEAQWDPTFKKVKAITFTMPYYEGGSLFGILQEGYRFSVGEAISITCQILDALHYLHVDREILHRDVKPGNVFVSGESLQVYLGDLGCAAKMNAAGEVDARGGTILYRAPEFYTGRYSVRSEIYSVGMILLELLNGAFPYAFLDIDDVENRLKQGSRPLKSSLLTPNPVAAGGLRNLVEKMLNPKAAQRPGSAIEAQRLLQRIDYLDWRLSPEDDVRIWESTKKKKVGSDKRHFQARERKITSGRHAGKFELTAHWRSADSHTWRGMASSKVLVGRQDESARREFFKSIVAAATKWAAAR